MRHSTYGCNGLAEQLLVLGPEKAAARILIIPPLFDEMNRMRHTLIEAMRLLADTDVATAIADLPGCNESCAALHEQSLTGWRNAAMAANKAFGATHIFSVRGGGLIDDGDPLLPILRLSPVKGKSLLNMMIRTRIAGDKESGITTTTQALDEQATTGPVELAGNAIGPAMWSDLNAAEPAALPAVTEIKPADIGGSALWLRAEPQHSAEMAQGLASALHNWVAAA